MIGWHHRLSGHEFEQPLGDSEAQGSLACYSSWGCKQLDTTEQQQIHTHTHTYTHTHIHSANSLSLSQQASPPALDNMLQLKPTHVS